MAIEHATSRDRLNLLMSPGMGKTACALMAMELRAMVADTYPALVIGPLRVANSVWNREVDKWAQLKGLRVVKVLGSLSDRIAALRTPADVYTIHYGLLKWLHEYLTETGTAWPFKTVIADESTRLKHARPSFRKHPKSGKLNLYIAGSANAGALARYAPRTPYWINMTGTYTPNGLQDAWGQQWFIDFGETLGSSYDAYTKRWFYQRRGTKAEQAIFEPFPHALDEITRRLQPSTISLDAYDWFDVEKPREVDIEIELPEKLMKDYRKLHRDAMLKLENETVITAVNAGAITNKCIAEGTPVLTPRGWVPIERVQQTDLVWDGEAFAKHGGVACNGLQRVVECFSVEMTPDHKVLTTEGWKEARACITDRLDRAEVRLPDRALTRTGRSPPAMGMPLRLRHSPSAGRAGASALKLENIVRLPTWGSTGAGTADPRHDEAPCMEGVEGNARTVLERKAPFLASVRRAWNQGLQALDLIREVLAGHGPFMAEGLDARPARQQPRVHAGQLQVGDVGSAGKQHDEDATDRNTQGAHVNQPSSPSVRVEHDDSEVSGRERVERRKAVRVYDLINAGPRHRFTVKGADGQALIVHNCLQYASGHVYDADQNHHFIHAEKLDALDSLHTQLNGAPLLVAYHFKPTREAILKRFPFAELLPSDHRQKAVEDRWNAGKIPMLVVHPASAGHGLDLQHGGHNLCIVDPYWDYEMYAQVIERIGPVRQAQAGYKRLVNVYRLKTVGTFDAVVIDRLTSKASIESAVRGAMQ